MNRSRATVVTPVSTDQAMRPGTPVVFLAGSIDEGRADPWQGRTIEALSDLDATILNPRRDAWNADLRQDIEEAEFTAQVDWELDGIEDADVVLFHFSPAGQAPITLMEIGIALTSGKRVVVSCPEGYWRRGNVQVLCRRHGVPVHDDLPSAIATLRTMIDGMPPAKVRSRAMPVSIGAAVLIRELIDGIPPGTPQATRFATEIAELERDATVLLAREHEGVERRGIRRRPLVVTRQMDDALRRALMASTTHVADPIILEDPR